MRLPEPLRGSSTTSSKIDCIAKLSIPCARLVWLLFQGKGRAGHRIRRKECSRGRRKVHRLHAAVPQWQPLWLAALEADQVQAVTTHVSPCHHPNQPPCRPLPSDAGPNPPFSRVPAAVETPPRAFLPALHTVILDTPHTTSGSSSVCLHTLFGGDTGPAWRPGAGQGNTSGYPPPQSLVLARRHNTTHTSVDPTVHCRLFCHVRSPPLLRRCSGGRLS